MYAMRFAQQVVWMWIGQAQERCWWYLKILTQLTANRSWAFCYNLNCLCSSSVQRHYDWGLVCLFIYLTTIFDCVSCVASNDSMKMLAEKQRLLEGCVKAHTSIYLNGLRRASATSQGCWHRNRKSNSGLLGTTTRLWPTEGVFLLLQFTANRVLVLPKHKWRTITIGLRKSILDRVWSDR